MLELIPGLNGLLDYFAKNRQHRDGQADVALTAIYTAANETKIYLAERIVATLESGGRPCSTL